MTSCSSRETSWLDLNPGVKPAWQSSGCLHSIDLLYSDRQNIAIMVENHLCWAVTCDVRNNSTRKEKQPQVSPVRQEDNLIGMCSRCSQSTGGPHIGEGYLLVQAMGILSMNKIVVSWYYQFRRRFGGERPSSTMWLFKRGEFQVRILLFQQNPVTSTSIHVIVLISCSLSVDESSKGIREDCRDIGFMESGFPRNKSSYTDH